LTGGADLGRASPVYFVGESHTLPFRDALFQPQAPGDIYLGRVRFLQIFASRYLEGGAIHPDILKALMGEQLLDEQGNATHLAKDRQTFRTAEVSGVPVREPVLVLFAGDLDVFDMLRQTGKGYDFDLPDDPGYGVDRTLTPIPLSAIDMRLRNAFLPFISACGTLREMGFGRIMIHSLPPRLRDIGAVDLPGALQMRAKLTVFANRVLRQASVTLGIPFIDAWQDLTDGLYLRPQFALNDGVHLTRAAAQFSWRQVIETTRQFG
jgi:hypothetical protein